MIVDIDELDGRFDQLPRPVRVGALRRRIILLYNSANGDTMTDKITPLTTEHLRIMRDDVAALGKRMDAGFTDIKKRLSRVEQAMIGLKRDEAETAGELT